MDLRDALEYLMMARVWINCYITAASSSSFGVHRDAHDAIIVQLSGSKRWDVDLNGPSTGPAQITRPQSRLMKPGWCLTVPAGTSHNVTGVGELTVHLTVAVQMYAGLLDATGKAQRLLGLPIEQLSESALALAMSRLPDRRTGTSLPFSVTGSLTSNTHVLWASRFPPVVDESDSAVTVSTLGRTFRFGQRLSGLITLLASGGQYSWGDVADQLVLTLDQFTEFVRFGVKEGFLICR